jgi:hypothetical protein
MGLPVGSDNYAPQQGESGADYTTRLKAIPDAPPLVLRAAKIIANAMELGIYDPYSTNKDTFSTALDNITNALKGFTTTKSYAGARDDLMQAAIEGVQKRIGVKVDISKARSLIAGKAESNLEGDLAGAVNKTWAEIKDAAELGESANNKKVVDSYKETVDGRLKETDLSRLAQDVLDLREKFRDTRKK